jgi:hypothetical protein
VYSYLYFISTNGAIDFYWYNYTTGVGTPAVITTIINGEPVTDFYDGRQVQYIDERGGTPTGGTYLLRNYGIAGWTDAYTARAGQPDAPAGSFAHDAIYMWISGYGYLDELYTGHLVTSINWNMRWRGCGPSP